MFSCLLCGVWLVSDTLTQTEVALSPCCPHTAAWDLQQT